MLTLPFKLPPDTKISPVIVDLLSRGYIKDPHSRPSMLDYLNHEAFNSIRAKYVQFFKKIYQIQGVTPPADIYPTLAAQNA